VFLPLFVLSLAFMVFRLWSGHSGVTLPLIHYLSELDSKEIIWSFSITLFIMCMVCHGELARLKPHPRFLTGFYVCVSLGGAVGGLFVGLIAPNLFRAYYEFPIGLGLCASLIGAVLAGELWHLAGRRRVWGMVALATILGGYISFLVVEMHDMVEGHRVVARNFYG